jgi:hypothetical protein
MSKKFQRKRRSFVDGASFGEGGLLTSCFEVKEQMGQQQP